MRFLTILACFFLSSTAQASWHMDPPGGFNWYKDNVPEVTATEDKQKISTDQAQSAAPQPSTTPHTDAVEAFQKELKEAQSRAVLHPTFENVATLKAYQDKAMIQSTDFSKMWMLVNLMSKDLFPQDNPNNQFRRMQRKEDDAQLDRDITHVARSYGLFFFFKEECPYCHEFAPHVKEFASRYGFEVQAISKDGSTIKEFPNAMTDNGMGKQINPEGITPALFMANPESGEIIPIAWGMVSPEELRQNIATVIKAYSLNPSNRKF